MGSGSSKDVTPTQVQVGPAKTQASPKKNAQSKSPAKNVNRQQNGGPSSSNTKSTSNTRPSGGDQHRQKEAIQVKSAEDIVFETFYHQNGKEYQCMYLGGVRYYLDDWGSKEWQEFPKQWYREGRLVAIDIIRGSEVATAGTNQQQPGRGQGRGERAEGSRQQEPQARRERRDDREGYLKHPTRGQLHTYIFHRKHNIHCYYDQTSGSWLRMPIGWELHSEVISKLVSQIEEAIPAWNDRHDILSFLRACNYDINECIATYLHLQGDAWMKAVKTTSDVNALQVKDDQLNLLQKEVKKLKAELAKEKSAREEAESLIARQEDQITDLEVAEKQAEAQLMVFAGDRPLTSMARSKSRMRPVTPAAPVPVPVQERVSLEELEVLQDCAKELHKSHVHLRMEVEKCFTGLRDLMAKSVKAVKQLRSSGTGQIAEMEEVRALYRKETLQRKLLYNQLQELRGNIRVFCRARKDDRAESCLKCPTDQDIVCTHPQLGKKMFTFDKVFDINTKQEQVFEDTKPIIASCVDGYNVCLMAYGQTGSGKTFTMMGPPDNPGINIRAVKDLFQICKERIETVEYELKVSLVEIYNETVQDLLNNDAKTLELRTGGNKVNIPGITEVIINNMDDIKQTMATGDKNRTTASTKMNSTSSRSHLLLMITVQGTDKVTASVSTGTLTLCDLAGSERLSKTEAEGQRLVEAAAINKSLSALGQVFQALRTSQLHIPYRNSKLTQILQPSLGGDAKACLFVNVSPDVFNFQETVSTLTFGANARQVALGQAKQNVKKGPFG
ncbi:hypothetical protein ScPMuIL_008362 [Solemya velum]